VNIGIVGSGNIGATTARLFADTGHEVAVSNSRGAESLVPLVDEIGSNARASSVEEAADFGEVVLVAMPFFAYEALSADRLAGKVVVDAMNYYERRDGRIDFNGLTSSEVVARHLPDSRLVKAFNTMYYQTLRTQGRASAPAEERLVLFVAGDDRASGGVCTRHPRRRALPQASRRCHRSRRGARSL
jgi:8-hydroxy-5-deazaflavin:NADPH oxidoreductase